MRLQILAICEKWIEVPDYLGLSGSRSELDDRVNREVEAFQDECIGQNLFSVKSRVIKLEQ